jgi:hypothetical protein
MVLEFLKSAGNSTLKIVLVIGSILLIIALIGWILLPAFNVFYLVGSMASVGMVIIVLGFFAFLYVWGVADSTVYGRK